MKKFIVITFLLGSAIVVVVLLFSGPRMKNNPSFRKFEAVYNLPPDDAVPFGKPAVISMDMSLPVLNAVNLSAGKTYYNYYCVFCHGEDGKGNGPVGVSYVPKPADLNNLRLKSYDTTQLYQASFTGAGHSPVLDRIVPAEWKNYILLYIGNEFIKK